MRDVEASFSLENLVCELYKVDIDPLSAIISKEHEPDIIKDLLTTESSAYAKKGKWIQQLPLGHLNNADLPTHSKRVLFHERIHYWQTLACTALQFRFITLLDKISFVVEKMSGRSHYICNQGVLFDDEHQKQIYESFNSMNSNFNYVEKDKVIFVSDNNISYFPFTAMPHVRLPHETGRGLTLPGYAAVLGFKNSKDLQIVPFSGRHIVESAAYIAEHVLYDDALPRISPHTTEEEVVYLGVWEFWGRLFRNKYQSEKDLALAFLSVVDLVLNPDLHDLDTKDEELFNENTSIPYRFGKLVYRMQYLPTLDCTDGDIDTAIVRFQEMLARHSHWTPPVVTIKKMIVFISRIIIRGFLSRTDIDRTYISDNEIEWMLSEPNPVIIKEFERVELLLENIYGAFHSEDTPRSYRSWPVGINILTSMLHSLFYRLKYPSRFCAPHIYSKQLTESYPLPIVLFRGNYFFDTAWTHQHSDEFPFPAYQMETALDTIGIAAISPLGYESKSCGLFDKKIECYYMKSQNTKCLQPYLNNTFDAINNHKDILDTFCHWAFHSLALKTAPEIFINHWKGRLYKEQ